MASAHASFGEQVRSLPSPFWVANTMEIFERMAWYGFYAVSSLYITGSVATGGLGFTSEQRGAIQGIIPFLLYLMPVLTGALADRYGYKLMFIVAYCAMIVSYYALGQFKTVPTFMLAFLFVAVAAAIFKPVVVGTVARVTSEKNSRLGFDIFYMMVNIGGFLGPIVAGLVRGISWNLVFIASSAWAAINLLICIFFYREPTTEARSGQARTLRTVLAGTYDVLGNARFGLTVLIVVVALMLAGLELEWFGWTRCLWFVAGWLVLNFIWDALLPRSRGSEPDQRAWFARRMHCSDWRFGLFLLLLSGFWTSYHQIFITMPEYLRDFVETEPVTAAVGSVFGDQAAESLATINEKERAEVVRKVARLTDDAVAASSEDVARDLLASKVRVAPAELRRLADADGATAESVADGVIRVGRQVNPEFIINLNSLAIVLFQVVVSYGMSYFRHFPTMIVGMIIAAVGIGLSAFAGGAGFLGPGASIWIICVGIVIFAFGEMMASPTSQEYVGSIAPLEKKALYMGYYFVAIALGHLFGGILSGQLYARLARDMQRPDLMWIAFGGLMLTTAALFVLYNQFVVTAPKALPADAPPSA